jgi:hypothetical protein
MSELRLPDDVVKDVEAVAADQGERPEAWASRALRKAVARARHRTPDGSLRERLRSADLLVDETSRSIDRPDPDTLRRARRLAGRGRPLSEYVREGRG